MGIFAKAGPYQRSLSYRQAYLEQHPGWRGWHMCAYCGRIVRKNTMQVDHIIAINKLNKNALYRPLIKADDVNSLRNLVASCPQCNSSKSDRGGFWILRGKVGPYLFPVVWVITLLVLLALLVSILSGLLTPEMVRETIEYICATLVQQAKMLLVRFVAV